MNTRSHLEEVIRLYFDASNQRDFQTIGALLQVDCIYSSENTGLHLGKGKILKMMRAFLERYSLLEWTIETIEERDGNTLEIIFTLKKEDLQGAVTISRGREKLTVHNNLITSIEVYNK